MWTKPNTAIRLAMVLMVAVILLSAATLSADAYQVWGTNQRTDKIQILDGTSLEETFQPTIVIEDDEAELFHHIVARP